MAYLHLHVPNPTDDGFNVAAPGANTDILAADLAPNRAGWFVGSIVLATASVVNYVVKQGATTFTVGLDESSSIPAGDVYSFGFPVHPDFTYNFQVETNGVIRQLVVSETDAPPGLPSNLGTVTVGDVTVTSVTPGTGATNLGKAEDAAHASGDVGVMPLVVRQDTEAALAADGDYVPVTTDATGRARVAANLQIAGTNSPGGAGAVTAQTPRTTLASDDPAVTALQAIDDWDETDRAKVNPIVGQAGVAAGAGAVGVTVQRTTLASDDPAVVALQAIDDWDETDRAKVNPIVGQAGVTGGSGVVGAAVQRVVLATDVALPAGDNNVGNVDVVSQIPGTGATNLGKAVDAAAGATDTGVATLAIRDDALAALVPAESDYVPLRTDSNGALWTHDDALDAALAGSELQVDVVTVPAPLSSTGGGTEAAALRVTVASDSTGVLSVDDNAGSLTVDNAALSVTGGGVEATALRVTIANDSTGLVSVDDNAGSLTVDNAALSVTGGGVEATALRVTLANDSTGVVSVDDNAGSLTVDVGAALPAGDNNIGNVDIVTVPAPLSTTGGGTEATALRVTLANDSTGLVSVDDNAGSLTVDNATLSVTGGGVEAGAMRVTLANDSTGLVSVDDNAGSLTVDNAALSVTGGGVEASALRVTVASDSTGVLSVDDNAGSLTVDSLGVGETGDAAATAGSTGSLSAKLRLLTTQLDAVQTAVQLIDNAVTGTNFAVVGLNASVAKDVTIQTAAYAAEDCLGGKFVFSAVSRTSGVGVFLKGFQFTLEDTNSPTPEVHIWLAQAALTSAPADNASMSAGAANAFGATDRDTLMGPFTVGSGDWEAADGQTLTFYKEVSRFLPAPTTQRDYGAIMKTGTALGSVAATRNLRITMEVGRN